ncbi:MAG: hypothetical protein Kow0092_07960 [Deferrisomatales bacterium]
MGRLLGSGRSPGRHAGVLLGLALLAGGAGVWAAATSAPLGPAAGEREAQRLVARLRATYRRVVDYRVRVVTERRRDSRIPEITEVVYRFRRPGRIRIDFLRPRRGLRLVFPDGRGRVGVRPGGWLGFLRLSLDPGNPLVRAGPGQRVDQTHLGLLVEKIAESVGPGRTGPLAVERAGAAAILRVEARHHFLPGERARYEFWIDTARWLPSKVHEALLSRREEREIRFLDWEINPGLSDEVFQLD